MLTAPVFLVSTFSALMILMPHYAFTISLWFLHFVNGLRQIAALPIDAIEALLGSLGNKPEVILLRDLEGCRGGSQLEKKGSPCRDEIVMLHNKCLLYLRDHS